MPRKAGAAFGRQLQEQFTASNALPHVFQRTVTLLSQHALGQDDLFTRDTDVRKVSLMRQAWDRGQDPSRYAPVTDLSATAKLLLQWLEALPQPLIPCQLYKPLVRISHLDSLAQQVAALQRLLCKAEPCSQQVLASLLAFLHRHATESGVPTQQLTSIFAPLLLRSPQWQSSCQELHLPDARSAQHVVDVLITEAPEIMRRDCALARASPPQSHTAKASEPHSQLKVKLTAEGDAPSQAKPSLQAPSDCTHAALLSSPDASPPTSRASCMDSLPAGCLSAYRGSMQNVGSGQSPPVSPRHATSSLLRQSSLSAASVVSNESSMDGVLDDLCSSAIQSVLLSDDKRPFRQLTVLHPQSSAQHREHSAEPMDIAAAADSDSSFSAAACGPGMQENAYACMPQGSESLATSHGHAVPSSASSVGSFEEIPLSPFILKDESSWDRHLNSVAA